MEVDRLDAGKPIGRGNGNLDLKDSSRVELGLCRVNLHHPAQRQGIRCPIVKCLHTILPVDCRFWVFAARSWRNRICVGLKSVAKDLMGRITQVESELCWRMGHPYVGILLPEVV